MQAKIETGELTPNLTRYESSDIRCGAEGCVSDTLVMEANAMRGNDVVASAVACENPSHQSSVMQQLRRRAIALLQPKVA